MDSVEYKKAIIIREVENSFLKLFSEGKLNGTVHTCVGQEFSSLAFAGQAEKTDFIVSNHRGHGHYISFFEKYEDLIAELLGKKEGICAGIGSSQHLYKKNFLTNGVQGGIVPVAAGISMAEKLKGTNNIVIVFIGDGTLGEGVVYETLNIISLWNLPLLIVCENNKYAQSTPQHLNLAGSILHRAEAFGIDTKRSDVWNLDKLYSDAKSSIDKVRSAGRPLFHLVDVYRLNAHSKGDDLRDKNEKLHYLSIDPLNQFEKNNNKEYENYKIEIDRKINNLLTDLEHRNGFDCNLYCPEEKPKTNGYQWQRQEEKLNDARIVDRINQFFHDMMKADEKIILIGEDLFDPYGGAFKVTSGLSTKYRNRVFTTPLSEAAITGIGNGLALNGFRPFVEIMFGDFLTLAFDQIVNHSSKFYHMYNFQANAPLVIRTPMGGWRGYGPTHSQSLERFLIGIDNVKVFSINSFIDPYKVYEYIYEEKHPVIVLENKVTYGLKMKPVEIKGYQVENNLSGIPVTRIKPVSITPTLTIVTYGYMATYLVDMIYEIIDGTELIPEIIILSQINPIDINYIRRSIVETRRLVVVEEGNETGGIGAQILLQLHNCELNNFASRIIGALPVPIPAVKYLENYVLPNKERILKTINELIK